VERMATSGAMVSMGGAHGSSQGSRHGALPMGMVGFRRVRSAGALGMEVGRLRGGRGAGALVCRSAVSPLGDSNGNVVEFQSGACSSTTLSCLCVLFNGEAWAAIAVEESV
jgi:hypothetical protein